MTTSNGQAGELIEGVVEAANERGIRVAGEWRNASKFHPVDLPDRGARVRLELDNKGFIRTLQVLNAAPSASSSVPAARDRTITRLACLKAAATFAAGKCLGGNAEIKSTDVLAIAEAWERWVLTPDQEDEQS